VHKSISPPLTRSQATAEAAKALGTPLTSSASSVAIYSSFVASSIYTFVALCTMSSPPLIATTAPTLHSLTTFSTSPSFSRVSSSHHYYLHSRTLASDTPVQHAGLGLTPPGLVPLTSQGRKSDLSKAIKHVGAEVASSHQSTLDGVLRALNIPSGVPR